MSVKREECSVNRLFPSGRSSSIECRLVAIVERFELFRMHSSREDRNQGLFVSLLGNVSCVLQGKGEMPTYWLSGVKESYVEQANLLELVDEEDRSTIYQISERPKVLLNVINRSTSNNCRCPFTGI